MRTTANVSHVLNTKTSGRGRQGQSHLARLSGCNTRTVSTFAERMGFRPVRSVLQIDGMDEALRNGLWNMVHLHYWRRYMTSPHPFRQKDLGLLLYRVWAFTFKQPTDSKPDNLSVAWAQLRLWFLQKAEWLDVYEFIQQLPNWYEDTYGDQTNDRFRAGCNRMLEQEMSAYRFVGGVLTRITSEEEADSIEQALAAASDSTHAVHLAKALKLLSDREQPDFRNSIKESVAAVEALSKKLSGSKSQGVKDALSRLNTEGKLPTPLKDSMTALYGYASNTQTGVRHAIEGTAVEVGFAEAKFALVTCSALINFMLERCAPPEGEAEVDA